MKKLILSILIAVFMTFLGLTAHALVTYNCSSLTGGDSRSLDYLSVSDLSDGDRAFVMYTSGTSAYLAIFEYYASGTSTEETTGHPYVVRPDDYATGGIWVEQPPSWVEIQTALTISSLTVNNDMSVGGTYTINDLDATGEITAALKIFNLTGTTSSLCATARRGAFISNYDAQTGISVIVTAVSAGDNFHVTHGSEQPFSLCFGSGVSIINDMTFVTGSVSGSCQYQLSGTTEGGSITVYAPADDVVKVYKEGSVSTPVIP